MSRPSPERRCFCGRSWRQRDWRHVRCPTCGAVDSALERAKLKIEPRCQRCGCTEQRACPGGCAWDPAARRRGKWVCTRCTGRPALAAR